MKRLALKGFKPQITKPLAMLMAICYLLHPLHQQVKTVFHEITHALEAPANILKHSVDDKRNSMHVPHDHELVQKDHQHQLLEIWDTLFEKSSSKTPSETYVDKFRIDKHLTNDSYELGTLVGATVKHKFWTDHEKLRNGYSKKQPDPPKYFVYKC